MASTPDDSHHDEWPQEPAAEATPEEQARFLEEVAFRFVLENEEGRLPDIDLCLARYPRYAADLAVVLTPETAPPVVGFDPSTETRERGRGWPARRIDRFDIVHHVSSAGGGHVYRAVDAKSGRHVALKVTLPRDACDVREVERFHREARILSQLEIPHVVHVEEFVEGDGGRDYMVMPWIDGVSLDEVIACLRDDRTIPVVERDRLEIGERVAIVRMVAQALGRVHELGILHRDLKPSNVMIEADLAPKLIDFGTARVVEDSRLTHTRDAPLGTPRYLAPELLDGDAKAARVETDVYGLGMTLYELLTLQPAFRARDRKSLYMAIVAGDVTPPRELEPMIPKPLARVVMRAIDRVPDRRYASMRDFVAALDDGTPSGSVSTSSRRVDDDGAMVWLAVAVTIFVSLLIAGIVLLVLDVF